MGTLKEKFHNISYSQEEIGSVKTETQSSTLFYVHVKDPDSVVRNTIDGQLAISIVSNAIVNDYPWRDWKIHLANPKVTPKSVTQALTLRRVRGQFSVQLTFLVTVWITTDEDARDDASEDSV